MCKAAFLEQILLDDAGKIRPQYDPDISAHNVNNSGVDQPDPPKSTLVQAEQSSNDGTAQQAQEQVDRVRDNHGEQGQDRRVSNPLKRKVDQPPAYDWFFELDDQDIAQYLPSQPLLSKVADFFCISFHHWIPYIHKQRLQTRVREGVRYAGFDLVLHALVAVVLRHMNPSEIFLDPDQIRQQTKISRMIVETYATRDVSVESLQALIFVVFDHVFSLFLDYQQKSLTFGSSTTASRRKHGL